MPDPNDPADRGLTTVRAALYVMRTVLMQVSGLAGILAFLVEMWNRAALENAVYSGVVVGGGVYLVLLLVDFSLEQIVLAARRSGLRAGEETSEDDEDDRKTKVSARGTRRGGDADGDQSGSDPNGSGSTAADEAEDRTSSSSDDSPATPSSPDPEQLAAV